jgi:hypothetical protein
MSLDRRLGIIERNDAFAGLLRTVGADVESFTQSRFLDRESAGFDHLFRSEVNGYQTELCTW